MPKYMFTSKQEIKPEHIVVLTNVTISSFHFDDHENYFTKHFEVVHNGETVRIRVRYNDHDTMAWLKKHAHDTLTLTIFPYQWRVKDSSGVVNFLLNAATQIQGE